MNYRAFHLPCKGKRSNKQVNKYDYKNQSIKLTSNNSTLANSNFSLTRTKTNFSENPPLIYRDFTLDNSNPPEKIKDSLFSLSWRFELSGVAVLVKNNYKGSQTERKRRGLDYTNLTVQMQSIHTQNHSHTHTHKKQTPTHKWHWKAEIIISCSQNSRGCNLLSHQTYSHPS